MISTSYRDKKFTDCTLSDVVSTAIWLMISACCNLGVIISMGYESCCNGAAIKSNLTDKWAIMEGRGEQDNEKN